MRKSWCTVWVGLGLALCLAGCQGLFPQPVYRPAGSSASPAAAPAALSCSPDVLCGRQKHAQSPGLPRDGLPQSRRFEP